MGHEEGRVRETELRGVVPDEEACVARLQRAGARHVFDGRLEDRRFDTADLSLARRDLVLRLRVIRLDGETRATLDWKGPASYESGFKHRDEVVIGVSDAGATAWVLEQLGLRVTREIDRDVRVFELSDAVVRFERFPRMDTLVEVEGTPRSIEDAIVALALPRQTFTAERLADFVRRYEARTGMRAAICEREARGEYSWSVDHA
jgi:predicted adenylyl cyclase CyaB